MEDWGYMRQADQWLIDNNVITLNHLDNVRKFLLVRFKSLKRVEIECDTASYQMKLLIKIRWTYWLFLRKRPLATLIRSLIQQYLPKYNIEVIWT